MILEIYLFNKLNIIYLLYLMESTNFANFNWDASTNMLDLNFNDEFMNIFPLPRRRNISMILILFYLLQIILLII